MAVPKIVDTNVRQMNVLDVCCGRSLMLPLLRYYAKDIASYTGVDISKANIKEAMRGATAKNLEPKDLTSYYPFRVGWKLGNVAEMSKVIPAGFADFVIYTSAIEHMHPPDGAKRLAECYKVMKPGAKMFLSCPNTPGNGYQTQYRAHVYEWGYDELKAKLAEIGFSIVQEVGLVTSVREMDEFYSKQEPALRDFYTRMKAYVPSAFLTAFMAIPFPREAKELLFIVQKPKGEENNIRTVWRASRCKLAHTSSSWTLCGKQASSMMTIGITMCSPARAVRSRSVLFLRTMPRPAPST